MIKTKFPVEIKYNMLQMKNIFRIKYRGEDIQRVTPSFLILGKT